MKKLIYVFAALIAVTTMVSCDNNDTVITEEDTALKSELTLKINNLTGDSKLASKDLAAKDGDEPICSDEAPAYVIITIDGVDYTVNDNHCRPIIGAT